jgi:hypothetical protein
VRYEWNMICSNGKMTLTWDNGSSRWVTCPSATFPPHISSGLSWDRSRPSAVRGQRITRQEMYCNVTLRRVRYDCCHGKAISITYSECVSLALVFQHAMRMRCIAHIFICGLPYFYIISFHKNGIDDKICVLIFSTTSVWNIFHSKKNWARYDQIYTLVFM